MRKHAATSPESPVLTPEPADCATSSETFVYLDAKSSRLIVDGEWPNLAAMQGSDSLAAAPQRPGERPRALLRAGRLW